MLVLTTPAVTSMEVSSSAVVDTDGTVTRTPWVRHALDHGAGIVRLEDAPATLTRVRVGGYDGHAFSLLGGHVEQPDPDAAICADLCADFDEKATRSTSARVATQLGLEPADVRTSVVYSGPVDRRVAAASGVTDAGSGRHRLFVADSTVRRRGRPADGGAGAQHRGRHG